MVYIMSVWHPPPHYNHVIFMIKSRQIFFVKRPSKCWKSVEGRQMTVAGRWCERPPSASQYCPCTVLAALCQLSLTFSHRYPNFLPPFCRCKLSSTDRVQILYSTVRVYNKENPLSYSALAHTSSTNIGTNWKPVEVDPGCMLAVLKNEVDKNDLVMYLYMKKQFGLYDQLIIELRRENEAAFINFMRMPPEMFDDLLHRISPRNTKHHTSHARRTVRGWRSSRTVEAWQENVVGSSKNVDCSVHERYRRTPWTTEGLYMDVIRSADGKIFATFRNVLQRSAQRIHFHERSWHVRQERCSETGDFVNVHALYKKTMEPINPVKIPDWAVLVLPAFADGDPILMNGHVSIQ